LKLPAAILKVATIFNVIAAILEVAAIFNVLQV